MGDFLFDEMKKLYPDLPDDQVVAKIEATDQGSQLPASVDAPPTPMNSGPQTNIQGPDTLVTAPAPTPNYRDMAIENVRQKYLGDNYSDAARQKLVDENKADASGPNILAGLAAFGQGLAGGNAAAAGQDILRAQAAKRNEKINQFDEGRSAQVKNIEEGEKLKSYDVAQAKLKREMDPASEESKLAQSLAMKMVPGKDFSGMTADQINKLIPSLSKIYDIEQKKLEHDDVRDLRRDELQARREDRQAAKEDKISAKASDSQNKALQNTQQLLESARGNPAAAQAERDIYAAQKANSLADLYGDPNKLSMPQVRLLASEIGKIASGGAPAMHELDGITPSTLSGKMSEWVTKFTNKPTAANAAEFVKQYQAYANSLTKDAQDVINDKYGRVIESRKDQLGDSNYQSLKTHYIDRFKNEAARKKELADTKAAETPAAPTEKIVNGVKYHKVPGGWQEVE